MEKILYANLLFDFYGQLLTEKQQQIYKLYYQEDLSMAEISENFGTTRQSVNDLLKRTSKLMENYDLKLCLIEKHLKDKEICSICNEMLTDAENLLEDEKILLKLAQVKKLISKVVN